MSNSSILRFFVICRPATLALRHAAWAMIRVQIDLLAKQLMDHHGTEAQGTNDD